MNVQQLAAARRDADAGAASAMAVAGLPQSIAPGTSLVAMAGSTFQGQTALALGVSLVSQDGRWIYKVAATNSRRGSGAVIGAGFRW